MRSEAQLLADLHTTRQQYNALVAMESMSKDAEVPNALPCSLQQTDYTPEAPLQQTLNPPGGLSLSRETHSVRLAALRCVTVAIPSNALLGQRTGCCGYHTGVQRTRKAEEHQRTAAHSRRDCCLHPKGKGRYRRSAVDLPSLNLRSWPRILLSLIACCSVASVHREHVRTRCVVDIAPPSPPPVTLLFARRRAGKPRQTRR